MIELEQFLPIMEQVLGKVRLAVMLVDMMQYRADPKFWDGILVLVGDDWLAEKQAAADQIVAKFRGAFETLNG